MLDLNLKFWNILDSHVTLSSYMGKILHLLLLFTICSKLAYFISYRCFYLISKQLKSEENFSIFKSTFSRKLYTKFIKNVHWCNQWKGIQQFSSPPIDLQPSLLRLFTLLTYTFKILSTSHSINCFAIFTSHS